MQVIMRKKAEKQLDTVIAQCERMFGWRVAEKFYTETMSYACSLATNPHLGPTEPLLEGHRRNYRSLVVHKHYKLVYYLNQKKDTIYIVALWDTRREPTTLSGKL